MTRNSSQRQYKFIISGGGTGGHIFPAIAIANALRSKLPGADILFIGAKGRMEMEKVPAAGFRIEGLWISGLQRKLSLKNLVFPIKLISSLIKAAGIIRSFKPDVVIGVGGYASGPTLRMAAMKKIPCLIQEQNSFPGITNKILAKKATKICVAYDGMEKFFPVGKIVLTGNPVRQHVVEINNKRREALQFFNLDDQHPTLLVVGGSQGSVSINNTIRNNLDLLAGNNIQIIWQTGKTGFEQAKTIVSQKNHSQIRVVDFIDRMDLAYAAADCAVSRAGAIAISEICAVGIPAILIPLPSAAEDHQTKNAGALVSKNAAILITDSEAKEKLGKEVIGLINDPIRKNLFSENLKKLAISDSASRIAGEIIKLANDGQN
jgi:UDP-N-acetylglucosamine--N-acetylmuramyl-(pentapeptide) pyrophosphoryl-undecaprenol N-acetylglucosamine transferase